MNILRMVNPVMPYAWGSKTFIHELLGGKKEVGKPQAELWMGAHLKSSSQILNGDRLENLHNIIAEDPCDFLGSRTSRTYHSQLPFLLKVLAAEQPLSVQVHPNKRQAREGFARENRQGIPLDAPKRNYKDAFHKPELLMALTPFSLLCGFRDFKEMADLLKKYLPQASMSEMSLFTKTPNPENLKEFYTALIKAFPDNRIKLLTAFLDKMKKTKPDNAQEHLIKEWTLKLNERYPQDIGILSPLLMNLLVLEPFEGIYLEPGVLHTYLHGAGIEIMANSDNVLRGGLTPKHVDKVELLKLLNFSCPASKLIKPEKVSPVEQIYKTPAEEFALSYILHSRKQKTEFKASNSAEILFCYEGSFIVENCSQFLSLEKGQSLFVPFEVEGYAIKGKGIIFRAKVNL